MHGAARITLEEWKAIPPTFAIRHQMLDGIHYMHRPPTFNHQKVLGNLMMEFWRQREREGDTALPYIGVVLSENDAVIPDFTFVSHERRDIVSEEYVDGAPDLIVEIVDDDTRELDEIIKVDRYGRGGVGEYWLVDLETETETVAIYRHAHARLTVVENVRAEDILTTPLLPELALTVREVFD